MFPLAVEGWSEKPIAEVCGLLSNILTLNGFRFWEVVSDILVIYIVNFNGSTCFLSGLGPEPGIKLYDRGIHQK
jgi:hypothetical protein